MDLSDYRKEYTGRVLRRADLDPDPVRQFEGWFREATELGYHEPNAMSLATVDGEGRPLLRTVLLKSFDAQGLVFFTNYESRKAQHMEANPQVALMFPWVLLERQVIVQGRAEKVSREESLQYFVTRPRDSRLGAWASAQSAPIASREALVQRFEEVAARYPGDEIPLPPFWGGYRVVPERIEFWQGGPGRLHDRFLYSREGSVWAIERLSP